MLRCLLKNLVLGVGIFIWIPAAKAFLFLAPTADSEEFKKFALSRNQQTYTQWTLREQARSEGEAQSQVLDFSQSALKEKISKQLTLDWQRLRQTLELNTSDRELLSLLAEKLNLPEELCRYLALEPNIANLLQKPESQSQCQTLLRPVPKALSDQLQADEALVIDGKAFTKSQLPGKLVPGSYRWKILSDRYEDRSFQGSVAEFAAYKFPPPQSWVRGSTKDYSIPAKDLNVLLQSQIYFNTTNVVPGLRPERKFSDWAAENKTLLWGVGLIVTGIAASQFRDKTLVITTP